MHRERWIAESGAFLLWGLTATTGLLAFFAMFTIGLFVLPVAGALLGWALVVTFHRPAREFTMIGVLLGPAAWSGYFVVWAARSYPIYGSGSGLEPWLLAYVAATVICLVTALLLFIVLGTRAHRRPSPGGKHL